VGWLLDGHIVGKGEIEKASGSDRQKERRRPSSGLGALFKKIRELKKEEKYLAVN